MELLETINPSEIAWVFCNNCFYFSRDTKPDYRKALSVFSDLSPSVPYGVIDESQNILQVPFDDEFIYTPYSTSLKGLRDIQLISDDTFIKFKTFHRKASLIFKQIYAFEKSEVLNSAERELEFSVGRLRYV